MTNKQTAISTALALTLGTGIANAGTFTTATFTMLAGNGSTVGVDTSVTGDISGGAFSVESTTPFFGLNWTAHNGSTFGPGTYTFDTAANNASGIGDTYTSVVVGANQIGGHILFDWGATSNIDVVMVWDVTYDSNGYATYTSSDSAGFAIGGAILVDGYNLLDGVRGYGMADGAFPGFNANFDFIAEPDIPLDLTATQGGSTFLINVGAITLDSGHTGGSNYQWNLNSDTDIVLSATTATTGSGANTLTIDPTTGTGPALNGIYTISVTVTNGGNTARADNTSINIVPFTMPSGDYDQDGTNNTLEGVGDSDSDGIPDYLDNSNFTSAQLQTSISAGSNSSVISTSLGAMAIGQTARSIGLSRIATDNTSTALSPALLISDLNADSKVQSSCVGGCFDFKVTGLNPAGGDSVQVTIPLSTAIPANAVYRKFDGTNWGGFITDAANSNDSIASAPASSTGPVTCPTPDSSSYTAGLTPGDFCIRLTLEDNGPNDADATLGTIADPGGIGTTSQTNPEDASAINGVGGGWWLLMGFPALFGMRRLAKK